jgi:hypothetical protein
MNQIIIHVVYQSFETYWVIPHGRPRNCKANFTKRSFLLNERLGFFPFVSVLSIRLTC